MGDKPKKKLGGVVKGDKKPVIKKHKTTTKSGGTSIPTSRGVGAALGHDIKESKPKKKKK